MQRKHKIFFALRTGGFNLGNGHHASTHELPTFCDRLQGYYIDNSGPESMVEFLYGSREASFLQRIFLDFKISHIPREQNRSAGVLATLAHTFHCSLIFVGCSILYGFSDHL